MNLPNMPEVLYYPNFLDKDTARLYFDKLLSEIEFAPETYVFESKDGASSQIIETKRKISYHSDLAYTYSTQTYAGKSWNEVLTELRLKIEAFTGYDFNAVLCNHYSDGEAGMGWHADKEKELGDKPVIASLSLGQTRRFAFRHRRDVSGLKNPPRIVEYTLNSGDLLIMTGDTQKYFEHCVVKDKSATETRINLTYRKIV